jgi:hypothetical protein
LFNKSRGKEPEVTPSSPLRRHLLGPDEILRYLKGSFAYLDKAIEAIGQKSALVRSSPISPLKSTEATRLALVVESLVHAFDHYGQMVEYLRMNGNVPPGSRP